MGSCRAREAVFRVLELVCELLEREGVFARGLAHGLAHLGLVLLHLGGHRKLVLAMAKRSTGTLLAVRRLYLGSDASLSPTWDLGLSGS